MQSNFLPLEPLNKNLYDYLYDAEELFVGTNYNSTANTLRSFCEGFLKECLKIKSDNISIQDTLKNYHARCYKEFTPDILGAIHKIRDTGNKASHHCLDNKICTKEDIIDLFKGATSMVNFLVKDYYKKPNPDISFSTKNLPTSNKLTHKKHEEITKKLETSLNKIVELAQQVQQRDEKIKSDDHRNASITQQLQLEKQRIEQEKTELEEKCKQLEQEKNELETIDTSPAIAESLNNTDFDSPETTEQPLVLSEAQQKIIALTSGKHFLQAPPGSGKTSVLTERMKFAINNYDDQQISCLTFTNKAAAELKHRVKKYIGKHQPFIGNFHGFCLNILRNSEDFNQKFKNFTIVDEEYRKIILDTVIKKITTTNSNIKTNATWIELCNACYLPNTKPKYIKEFTALFFNCYLYLQLLNTPLSVNVNNIKNILEKQLSHFLFRVKELFNLQSSDKKLLADKVWQMFNEFKRAKFNYKTLDFDDILFLGLKEITQQKLTQKFIQVDEIQDLSPIQWGIINQLCNNYTHLLVAGDPEQLIYGFINADIKLLTDNTETYSQHSLVANYRSSAQIISLLNCYRQHHLRLPAIQTTTITNAGSELHLIEYLDDKQECYKNVQLAKQMPKISKENIAILLRSNIACEQYCEELKKQEVNFFHIKPKNLMQTAVLQDWLSLLRIYRRSESIKDWWRLVYRFAKSKITKNKVIDIINLINKECLTLAEILATTQNEDKIDVTNYPIKTLINGFNNQGVVVFKAITTSNKFDAKIIKLTAIKIIQNKIVAKFSQSIKQDFEFNSELKADFLASEKYHNISLEEIETAASFAKVTQEFFEFIADCPLISHDEGFNYSILRLNIQEEKNNYELLKSYYNLHDRQFSSLRLSSQLFAKMKSYKPQDLVKQLNLAVKYQQNISDYNTSITLLVSEIINQLQQKIPAIDNILTEHQNIFIEVIEHYTAIDSIFAALAEGDKEVEIADILIEWVEYVKQHPSWYDKKSMVNTEKDINNKLVPWLVENNYRGVFNNLIDEKNPLVERLFTLKEIDLIDVTNYQVIVCTIHQAKGLEFKTVFIPQANENMYNTWYDNDAIKLLYVALSRATDNLIMSYSLSYKNKTDCNLTPLLAPCKTKFTFEACKN